MIELSPYNIIPLIQLWATISVLFFYQNFFKKHPLESQLDELNKSLEHFYEFFQGYIYEDIRYYISVKWKNFFRSIKRMTATIFFYSIFLLFYLKLSEDYSQKNSCLYHDRDIFFLTATNVYMIIWVFVYPALAGIKKIINRKWRKKENDFFNTNKKNGNGTNDVDILNTYLYVFVFFFLFLFIFFTFFAPVDSWLAKKGLSHVLADCNTKDAKTWETYLTLFALFICVPTVIYIRIKFDQNQIAKIKEDLPNNEEVLFLNDISSMPIKKMNKLLASDKAPKAISIWRNKLLESKASKTEVTKKDIRDYIIRKSKIITLRLRTTYLDITYENENPIKGLKFTENQELQLNKITKNQIDLFFEKCKNEFSSLKTPVQQSRTKVNLTAKPSPKVMSNYLRRIAKKVNRLTS